MPGHEKALTVGRSGLLCILHVNLNLVILVYSVDADNNGNQQTHASNDHDREHFHDGLLDGNNVVAKTP